MVYYSMIGTLYLQQIFGHFSRLDVLDVVQLHNPDAKQTLVEGATNKLTILY